MNVTVELQNASSIRSIPLRRQFRHWANAAMNKLAPEDSKARLSIRIMDEQESAALNSQYRHKTGATNILSFPVADSIQSANMLGDLAICAPVVIREAQAQHKDPDAHWAHLVVHGILHLNGYDHESASDAEQMEELEINILGQLGIKNPYLT